MKQAVTKTLAVTAKLGRVNAASCWNVLQEQKFLQKEMKGKALVAEHKNKQRGIEANRLARNLVFARCICIQLGKVAEA
jgi:hypothetical protein